MRAKTSAISVCNPPFQLQLYHNILAASPCCPSILLRRLYRLLPYKLFPLKDLCSSQGKQIDGDILMLPLTPDDILACNTAALSKKLGEIERIARRRNVDVTGIGGYLASLINCTDALSHNRRFAMTNGVALTAWALFEGILRVAKGKGIDLGESAIAVCDIADCSVIAAARALSEYAGKIILVSSQDKKLQKTAGFLTGAGRASITLSRDPIDAFKQADIIVTSMDLPDIAFSFDNLKPGAVIFNLSAACVHLNPGKNTPAGVTVIKAGLLKAPFKIACPSGDSIPIDVVPAAFAETLLMAFESRHKPYVCPDALNFYAMEEIADTAARHGFEIYVPETPVA